MKIIVFGGSGFLGSHVADALSEAGHHVTIFDLRPSAYLRKGQKFIHGDMLNASAVKTALRGMDAVYNFAGFADLNESSSKPVEAVRQNILATTILLDACVQARVKRVVYASTIYVYSQLGGFYRCSKQAGELFVEEFHERYGLNYTVLRFGTLYGPRSDQRNSIWRYVNQALSTKKLTFHGTGEETREYIHVRDAARLSADILSPEFANQHVIITGHHGMKTKDMLTMIKEILNNKVKIQLAKIDRAIHYTQTPYSYIPKIGKKLVSNCYEDMGQGLLEIIHEMGKDMNKKKKTHR